MKIKANVCRIAYANTDIEVEVPDDATDEQIEDAIDEVSGYFDYPNPHTAEYELQHWSKVE